MTIVVNTPASPLADHNTTALKLVTVLFLLFHRAFYSFSFSPIYALIYIIEILSQAVTLVALFTPTCFDPYGSSSGSIAGPC